MNGEEVKVGTNEDEADDDDNVFDDDDIVWEDGDEIQIVCRKSADFVDFRARARRCK